MPHVARQRKQSPQKRRTSTASVEDYGVRQLSVTERLEDTGRDMYGVGEGI